MGGSFRMYDFNLDFEPRELSLLYLRTETILHGSIAPPADTPADRFRMGVALTNIKGELTRSLNQLGGEAGVTWGSSNEASSSKEPA